GQVSELPTSVPDALLEPFTFEHVQSARQRMARILADGRPTLETISLHQHIDNLTNWMADQQPLIIGVEFGLVIDPASPHLIYLLQPTRLVARKRIPRDIDLIQALFRQAPFQDAFASNPELQIVLHITGPVPIEHRNDLLDVLHAYRDMANLLPDPIAKRIFLAFSVGREEHPSFSQEGLASLRITDIYRMATAVLFPSQTEGRGLPIIEAAAIGVPIICSRYQPESVFAEVVGEHLPAEDQLQYTLFPEGDFSPEFLKRIADLLLQPQDFHPIRDHNQAAVRTRFSRSTLTAVWKELLERLAELP
ncbi:MAG: glycosyltransferase, partial [Anaerolineae bacterium]|nr:glycosyltransferase [Anaerolineae bacterium]